MFIIEVSYGYPSKKYPIEGIFEFDQAKALAKAGHKIVLAVLDVRSIRRWRKWGIHRLEKDGITIYHFSFPVGPAEDLCSAVRKFGFSLLFKKIVEDHGVPDLVHAHFGDIAGCVSDTCTERTVPYVVTEHASSVNVDVLAEKRKTALVRTYSKAAQVIAVSSRLVERIKQHTGTDAVVVPNIVDLSVFRQKKAALSGCAPKYISAGRIDNNKGHDVLIHAFSRVLHTYPDAALQIMGDGPELANLKALVKNLGIEGKVNFYGAYRREDFAHELAKSDIFALASRGETFGVVYVEALACGVPVIATRCGGPEDFVDDSNGLLIPVDDIDALCDAMLTMAGNIQRYDSAEISEKVHQSFSSETIARKLTSVFESI